MSFLFFFNDTATTEIYTLSLHDALPIYPVPLAVDVAAVVGRVVELLDLDVDVQVLLEVSLHELHLRGHLREILVVEDRRLEALAVSGLGHELLGLVRTVLPPGTELL